MSVASSPRTSGDHDSLSRVMSHGRGGAGNIAPDANGYKETEEDLRIPTLKSPVYTTGRGGTGNMALNDDPLKSRAAQDVEEVPLQSSVTEFHGGRGGAGNVVDAADEEQWNARRAEADHAHQEKHELTTTQKIAGASSQPAVDHSKIDYRGWADRGKDMLFGKKRKAV